MACVSNPFLVYMLQEIILLLSFKAVTVQTSNNCEQFISYMIQVLAGMDVDRPENMQVRTDYNITGFPTIYYFE